MASEKDKADAFLNRAQVKTIVCRMIIAYALLMNVFFWKNLYGFLPAVALVVGLLGISFLYSRFAIKVKILLVIVLASFLGGALCYRGYILKDSFGTFFETGMLLCPLILLFGHTTLLRARFFWKIFLGFTLGMSLFISVQFALKEYARVELQKTTYANEKKSESGFKVKLSDSKSWKFVKPEVAERLFRIRAKDASLVIVSQDAKKYGLFYATPRLASAKANPQKEVLLKKFMSVSKSNDATAQNVQDVEIKRGLATSGTRYENAVASTYVGFQRQLESLDVTLVLASPTVDALKLFADLETLIEGIEAVAVTETKVKRTAIDIYDEYNKAVVLVQAYDANRRMLGFGSGFNVSPEGLIVTNLHVLAGGASSYIIVKFPYHGEFQEAMIAGVSDPQTDLALLDIEGENLPSVSAMTRPEVMVGQPIFVIGNPQGLINTLSPGIISGVRERDHVTLYQITAPISGGSSGGPVFNEVGEVICVATASHQGGQNLNFCTSIDQVERIRETSNLRREAESTVQPINPDLAKLSREFESHLNEDYLLLTRPGEVKRAILYAIEEGAKLFNQGDHAGTFQIYDFLARKIIFAIDPTKTTDFRMKTIGEIVNATRQVALRSDSAGKAAWVLRYGFDIILKAN
jgi:serine protease Do